MSQKQGGRPAGGGRPGRKAAPAGRAGPPGPAIRDGGGPGRTWAEAAEALGLAERTLRNYVETGMPGPVPAGPHRGMIWDLGACTAWISERRARAAAGRPSEPVCMEEALRRKTQAEAELRELELAKKRGVLIERDQAREQCRVLTRRFIQILDRAAPELATQLAGAKTSAYRDLIEQWAAARRTELADELRATHRRGDT